MPKYEPGVQREVTVAFSNLPTAEPVPERLIAYVILGESNLKIKWWKKTKRPRVLSVMDPRQSEDYL